MYENPRDEHLYQKLKFINDHLDKYINNHQGVIFGKTAVISRKVHVENPDNPGIITVLIDKDAGINYLSSEHDNSFLHINILHRPAQLNHIDIANRINRIIPKFLALVDRNYDHSFEEKEIQAAKIASKIHVKTSLGQITADYYDLQSGNGNTGWIDEAYLEQVQILADLKTRHLGLVYFIVAETEKSILNQGGELRNPAKIVYSGNPPILGKESGMKIYIPGIKFKMKNELKNQNFRQILLSLSTETGSLDATKELIEALSPLKRHKLSKLLDCNPNLEETLSGLEEANIIKKSLLGYTLTESGLELENFLDRNKKELSAAVRKSIKKFKPSRTAQQTVKCSHLKSKERQFANRRKVVSPGNAQSWKGEVALPETIVQAAKRSFLERSPSLSIKDRDIQVYGKKSYAPVDICLLVDCSGSMKGERIRAVSFVAEYLLLNSREKISLVTFQENQAKVVVPFTRNYDTLHKGLGSLEPAGLTPLAHGINKALEMFKKERPRNPLLVLVTDGIPNQPMNSLDPVKDALTAAEEIAREKIRFICIGIDPNRRFLPKLAKAGNGNIYIVNDSNKDNMLDIINHEKKQYQFSR